ncbi:MAG: hypothetical protein ACXU82_03925 [Caulobacteraceae bacterium]
MQAFFTGLIALFGARWFQLAVAAFGAIGLVLLVLKLTFVPAIPWWAVFLTLGPAAAIVVLFLVVIIIFTLALTSAS